jgi:hypothetical protein
MVSAHPVFRASVLLGITAVFAACASAPSIRSPAPAATGAPPADIYVYRFARLGRGSAVFNITNRKGYDNQPFWDGNSRLLYTSQEPGQTDIYEINFGTSTVVRLTETPESEYSPAPTPEPMTFSVVRVERDSTQRLWRFPKDRSAPSLVLRDIKPVGYYAWLDTATLALFVLGSPATLQIADIRTGTARVVASNIGRSLQRVPGSRRASFVQRVGDKWVLATLDPDPRPDGSFDIDTLATMPDGADFVVWKSSTEAFTAAGSRLLRLRLPQRTWTLVEDLDLKGVFRISRLALSPDGSRLALVADEPSLTQPQATR